MAIQLIKLDSSIMLGKRPTIEVPDGCWMAGGAIRQWFVGNEKSSDVDFFYPNSDSIKSHVEGLIKDGYQQLGSHKNAITLSDGKTLVQAIQAKFYKDVQELLESFDYNLCQFAWDGKEIFSTPESIISVSRNHLGVNKLEGNVVDSLRRAFKYAKKGYFPCNGSIMKIAHSLRGLTEKEVNDAVEISPGGGRAFIRMD